LPKPEIYVVLHWKQKDKAGKYIVSRRVFSWRRVLLDVKIRVIYEGKKGYACKKRKEAAIKTTIDDSKYFGATKQDTVLRLREKFNIPQNEADELMKEYW